MHESTSTPTPARHQDTVVDQFTKQALPFSTAPVITNEETLRRLVDLAEAGPQDTVLDVACGPGLIVCAFAVVARQAVGIDLTPAMIERARALQREKGLSNVSWRVGDVLPLPYEDASFSIVTSRYAFHHFENPPAVMAEMARVCAPGGKVVLVDGIASPDAKKAAAFNRMEKLRDPSHVRTMALAELAELPRAAGLVELRTAFYGLEVELEKVLQASFPDPGDADKIRRIFVDELTQNNMDVQARGDGIPIHFTYPIAIIVAGKPRWRADQSEASL